MVLEMPDFKHLGVRLGESRVWSIPIQITQEHISRTYPPRIARPVNTFFQMDERDYLPQNPVDRALQEFFGERDITCYLSAPNKGRCAIQGCGYSMDPHMVLWLRHYYQGRPVRPVSFNLELYEGRLPNRY